MNSENQIAPTESSVGNFALKNLECCSVLKTWIDEEGLHMKSSDSHDKETVAWSDVVGCHCKRSPTVSTSAFFSVYAYAGHEGDAGPDGSSKRRKSRTFTFELDSHPDFAPNLHMAGAWRDAVLGHLNTQRHLRQRRMRVLVVVNPFGGTGKARTQFDRVALPVLDKADIHCVVVETERKGHASELARNFKEGDIDAIIVCAGDGVMHEIINGIFSRPDWESASRVPLGILPGGTSNGLAASLLHIVQDWRANVSPSTLMHRSAMLLARRRLSPLDLLLTETGAGVRVCSFLSICYGLIADADIESEKYRSFGLFRNTVGSFVRIVKLKSYKCRYSFEPAEGGGSAAGRTMTLPSRSVMVAETTDDGALDEAAFLPRSLSVPAASTVRENSVEPASSRASDDLQTDTGYNSAAATPETASATTNGIERVREAKAENREVCNGSGESSESVVGDELKLRRSRLPPVDADSVPSHWRVRETEIVVFCALNVSHLASDALSCPPAKLDDGLVHLVVVRKGISKMSLLKCLVKLETPAGFDEFVRNPYVDVVACTAFRLDMLTPGILTVDGELVPDGGRVQAEVMGRAVQVMS